MMGGWLAMLLSLRVVSLAPNLTELSLWLGAASELVGVTRHDPFPAVQNLPKVGGFARPDWERILRLHPDLVLLTAAQRPLFQKNLDALHLPYRALTFSRLRDVQAALDSLARWLDRAENRKHIQRMLDSLHSHPPNLHGRRVIWVIGRTPGKLTGLYAAGRNTFHADLIRWAGGKPFDAFDGYHPLDLETLIRWQPDWILELGPVGLSPNDWTPLRDVLHAVKAGHVYHLPPNPFARPGLCAWLQFRVFLEHREEPAWTFAPCPPPDDTSR
jgi:iron complex transport system substrate-binding protein